MFLANKYKIKKILYIVALLSTFIIKSILINKAKIMFTSYF